MRDDTKIKPRQVTATGDAIVVFMCISFVDVKWFFNNGSLPGTIKPVQKNTGLENYLVIPHPTVENSGVYKCHGKDPHTNNYYFAEGILDSPGNSDNV